MCCLPQGSHRGACYIFVLGASVHRVVYHNSAQELFRDRIHFGWGLGPCGQLREARDASCSEVSCHLEFGSQAVGHHFEVGFHAVYRKCGWLELEGRGLELWLEVLGDSL